MKHASTSPRTIGLLVGREWSWPPAFIEEVNRRQAGVTAEYVSLGAPSLDGLLKYDVVVDRISHEVPFYRSWLKHALVRGVRVINSPLMWTADDKFFGATLAEQLGVRSPRTVLLPNKEYVPGIKHDESLRNLQYPLDWQGVIDHVGLPCILKDAHGGGWRDVYVCRSLEELLHHYDNSGMLTMIVQEYIQWDEFVRCICIGRHHVAPIKYDPRERRYHDETDYLPPEQMRTVVRQARRLVRALGYDMNSIEFAIRDGVPYAIDFMNPAPDFDIHSLGPKWFEWVVQRMADVTIAMAFEDRGPPRPRASALMGGKRPKLA
ncbi:MAG TPA: hypothetical protein PLL69_01345 [Gemmatimonadales bacterium]|nr:hypothetical protein [Gemmatimonadales bacterium]